MAHVLSLRTGRRTAMARAESLRTGRQVAMAPAEPLWLFVDTVDHGPPTSSSNGLSFVYFFLDGQTRQELHRLRTAARTRALRDGVATWTDLRSPFNHYSVGFPLTFPWCFRSFDRSEDERTGFLHRDFTLWSLA
jgi:hypothetical protein